MESPAAPPTPDIDPDSPPGAADEECAARLVDAHARLKTEIAKVIIGQEEIVEKLLISLFAGGHTILTGVPGLAKTLLVSTLSRLLSLSFGRIQFTPDLMPSDITGTDVLEEDQETGRRRFRFLRGPVFTHLLLADEINRTPPKTQAALLEAMQERRVTTGDRTYALPAPFFVVATQNPIEQEGTYRLPEAQLDRFLFGLRLEYPAETEELEIMKQTMDPESIPVEQVLDAKEILRLQEVVPRVPAAEHVYRFAMAIIRRTRPDAPDAPPYVQECVSWGAGPRAAKYLIHAARARALLSGRCHVTTGDVEAIAPAVLEHRLVTNFHAAAEGIDAGGIVARLIDEVRRDVRA